MIHAVPLGLSAFRSTPYAARMAVLVTGAAGFIGAATSRALLDRGDEVVGIDNLNDYYDPTLKQARLNRLSQDFGDRFRFDRVDHPLSLYAATKKSDELLSESYANIFRVALTGLRFFTVYGPWGRPDMAMWIFTKALYEGEPLPLFNHGHMHRDFTYIDDIVNGVVACLDHPPADDGARKAGGSTGPHVLYNIGNSRSEDLMRVVALLEQATGKTSGLDLQPMQIGDVPKTAADISDIQRDLGFNPATSIDEGVPRFVDWYREYHGL